MPPCGRKNNVVALASYDSDDVQDNAQGRGFFKGIGVFKESLWKNDPDGR